MINIDGIEITPLLDTLKLQKIDDEIYFSTPYKKYVSNSRLSLLFDNEGNPTPDKFFEGFKSGYNSSFTLGSRTHELILQPDLFELVEIPEKPSAKLGAVADELYPIYKETQADPTKEQIIEACQKIDYYSKSLTDNKINTVLESSRPYWQKRYEHESNYTGTKTVQYEDSKTCETVFGCVNAVNNNKYHQSLLHPKGLLEDPISECEQAILIDMEVKVPNCDPVIIRFKSKVDNYTIDKENNVITVNDLKTIGRIVSEFEGNFQRFAYYRELSIYCWLLSMCAKKFYGMNNPTMKSNCLVVSTIPGHYTKTYKVTREDFVKGWNEFKERIKYIAKYITEGYEFK